MVRSIPLLAVSSILLSGESAALASVRRSSPRSALTSPTNRTKKNVFRSSTCLTSAYVDVERHVSIPMLWRLPSYLRGPSGAIKGLLSSLQRQRRRVSKRIIAAILAAVIVLAPYSAHAATTVAVTASATPAAVPFAARSRALGTFNILPTRAELELCFRLLYAACSGAFVGLERSTSDRPAGVRTMALVGLGACTYTICSAHGFLPHTALGCEPGSPIIANVKCDLSRMAANIASGVGFIGAGAIHKSSKLHDNGSEAQNVVAGLTTAAAIWVSAAVGIASAVGLYFVGAAATFSTVAILKYARLSKEVEPDFSWHPRPLDVVDAQDAKQPVNHLQDDDHQELFSPPAEPAAVSGLFGTRTPQANDYDPRRSNFADQDPTKFHSRVSHPIIIKADPRFEKYLCSQLAEEEGSAIVDQHRKHVLQKESKVRIEEEQEIISCNMTDGEQGSSIEP